MSIEFSFRYNSSSLRFDLTPWQFQNVMFREQSLSMTGRGVEGI